MKNKNLQNLQKWTDGEISYLELARRAKRTPQGAGYFYLKAIRDHLKVNNKNLYE